MITFVFTTSGSPILTDQAASILARLILPELLADPAPVPTVAPPALPVAAPSLPASAGWEQGGAN